MSSADESFLLVRNVRPWARYVDEPVVDILCSGGQIIEIADGLSRPESDVIEIDGVGGIALPGLTDAHTHLDSSRLGLPFRSHTAGDGILNLIENDRQNWREAGASVADRATFTTERMVEYGVSRIRSHAQVDAECRLERLEGVAAAREAHEDKVDIQIVAFPQSGIIRDAGTTDLLEAAFDAGADVIGGIDPAGIDRDPVRHLDVVFGIANRHQCGVDIHLHDRGELGAFEIELICERTAATGMQGLVTVSHCFALATVSHSRQNELIDLLAEAEVAVVTVAPGTTPPIPLEQLQDAGVTVGLGQDGIQGYWGPYGNGDLLDRAWQLAYSNGFRHDDKIEACVSIATEGGAAIMGAGNSTLAIGGVADFFVIPGDTVTAAVMDRSRRELVVKGGRVIAREGKTC